MLRWTQRANGSWRKPEVWPLDSDQLEWQLGREVKKKRTLRNEMVLR